MSEFGDITGKAKDFLASDKVKDALKSEQAEGVSDKLLDGVAGVANRVTGGKYERQIDGARDTADDAIGTDKRGTAEKGSTHKGPAKKGTPKRTAGKQRPTA